MHLNASLAINDKNAVTYYNYGNLLVEMKHIEEAKEMYKKALDLREDFKEAREELEKL
jgi:tetratricopeptide (TPR) repeat protein